MIRITYQIPKMLNEILRFPLAMYRTDLYAIIKIFEILIRITFRLATAIVDFYA